MTKPAMIPLTACIISAAWAVYAFSTALSLYPLMLVADVAAFDLLAVFANKKPLPAMFATSAYCALRIAQDAQAHAFGHAQFLCLTLLASVAAAGAIRIKQTLEKGQ